MESVSDRSPVGRCRPAETLQTHWTLCVCLLGEHFTAIYLFSTSTVTELSRYRNSG